MLNKPKRQTKSTRSSCRIKILNHLNTLQGRIKGRSNPFKYLLNSSMLLNTIYNVEIIVLRCRRQVSWFPDNGEWIRLRAGLALGIYTYYNGVLRQIQLSLRKTANSMYVCFTFTYLVNVHSAPDDNILPSKIRPWQFIALFKLCMYNTK